MCKVDAFGGEGAMRISEEFRAVECLEIIVVDGIGAVVVVRMAGEG